jgi:hypothetical protein
MRLIRVSLVLLCAAIGVFGATNAKGAVIAVFGDNETDNYLASIGHSVTLVTDADLATPGFLSSGGFEALFVTRDGFSFGVGLSPAAAANVVAWVADGDIVLFNGDLADSVFFGDPDAETIYANAAAFAAASGHGYVGEFNGSAMAYSSNSNGFVPLGLIPGAAGPLTSGGAFSTPYEVTGVGAGHPVMAGVPLVFDPADSDFGTVIGAPAGYILATYDDGTPAIVAGASLAAAVPEPSSMVVFSLGAIGMFGAWRRSRKQKA